MKFAIMRHGYAASTSVGSMPLVRSCFGESRAFRLRGSLAPIVARSAIWRECPQVGGVKRTEMMCDCHCLQALQDRSSAVLHLLLRCIRSIVKHSAAAATRR